MTTRIMTPLSWSTRSPNDDVEQAGRDPVERLLLDCVRLRDFHDGGDREGERGDRPRAADRGRDRLGQLAESVDQESDQRQDGDQPEKVAHPCRLFRSPGVDGLAVPEDGDQDREADGDLGRGDAHDHEHEARGRRCCGVDRARTPSSATLTPFSITSTDMRMMSRLRRAMTPYAPIANRAALTTEVMGNGHSFFLARRTPPKTATMMRTEISSNGSA